MPAGIYSLSRFARATSSVDRKKADVEDYLINRSRMALATASDLE